MSGLDYAYDFVVTENATGLSDVALKNLVLLIKSYTVIRVPVNISHVYIISKCKFFPYKKTSKGTTAEGTNQLHIRLQIFHKLREGKRLIQTEHVPDYCQLVEC